MAHPPFARDFARQARHYRQGRDRWRKRCADKQDEIRALRVRVRDLLASRERWKKEAIQKRSRPQPLSPAESDLGGAPARRLS